MSKYAKLLGGAILVAGVMAAPVGARAQHHYGNGAPNSAHHGGHHGGGHHGGGGGHHGGRHYGGSYHGGHGGGHYGYHGGYHGYRGGGVYLGFGVPGFYYGAPYADPYYDDPYYYDEPPPDCDWVQMRVWRYGRWVWRNVQRCD